MSKFCEKCGNKLPDDALFCDQCGAKTDYTPQQPAAAAPVIKPREEANVRQTSPEAAPKPEKKGKSPIVIGAIILSVAAFIAAGVFLFIFLSDDDDEGSSKSKKSSSNVSSEVSTEEDEPTEEATEEETDEATEAPEPETTTEAPEETTAVTSTTTEAETETTAETTTTTTTAAEKPEGGEIKLPKSIEKVPDGMTVAKLGGLAVAVPDSFTIDESELEYHYTINIESKENESKVTMSYSTKYYSDTAEYIVLLEEIFGGSEKKEHIDADGYTIDYLKSVCDLYDDGSKYNVSYYMIVPNKTDKLYEIIFISSDEDEELVKIEKSLAFDPSVVIADSSEEGGAEAGSHDASGDATFEDFKWREEALQGEPTDITSFDKIKGRWKAFCSYDDLEGREVFNVTVSGSENDVSFKIEFVMSQYNGELPTNEKNEIPITLNGTYKDGVLDVKDNIAIKSAAVYTDGTKDYFVGTLTSVTGAEYPFCMVRP